MAKSKARRTATGPAATISPVLCRQKAAIYVRVSTQYQIDRESLPVQKDELSNYARYVLSIDDFEIFEDAGFSAKNTDRPSYQRMMARIRVGEFTHLLVWKIDRISRNLLDFTSMFQELKRLGVTFISKNEKFDTSTAMGEAMLKIILVFAELERNMTSERVRSVMLSMAESGKWNGGKVPYGYRYDKETKQFSVDPQESAVVKLIYQTYLSNSSVLQTSREINNAGYRTKQGNEWSAVTIHKVLSNVWYKGQYRYNYRDETGAKQDWTIKDESEWIVTDNHHERIVSDEQWASVNRTLSRNLRGGFRRYESYARMHTHMFAGLLKCGYCGSNMVANKDTKQINGWRPSKYACSKRHRNRSCQNKITSDPVIGPVILCYISNMMTASRTCGKSTTIEVLERKLLKGDELSAIHHIDKDSLIQFMKMISLNRSGVEYQPPEKTADGSQRTEADILSEELASKERALNRLQTIFLYSDAEMPESEYVQSRKEIVTRMDAIKARLAEIQASEADSPSEIEDREFMERASYFLIAENLLERRLPFRTIISKLDDKALKDFFNNIIQQVVVKDGMVLSITFRNGSTHKFIY